MIQHTSKKELRKLIRENEFFYRGTSHTAFEDSLRENRGKYCSYIDDRNSGDGTPLTWGDFDGKYAMVFCNANHPITGLPDEQNSPLFLAIRHQKYRVTLPEEGEGLILLGLIEPEDIVKVETEKILRQVWPAFDDLSKTVQNRLKEHIGIK